MQREGKRGGEQRERVIAKGGRGEGRRESERGEGEEG
jgi:hypothetical protein